MCESHSSLSSTGEVLMCRHNSLRNQTRIENTVFYYCACRSCDYCACGSCRWMHSGRDVFPFLVFKDEINICLNSQYLPSIKSMKVQYCSLCKGQFSRRVKVPVCPGNTDQTGSRGDTGLAGSTGPGDLRM